MLRDPHRALAKAGGWVGRQHLGRAAGEARQALVFVQFEAGDLVPVHPVGAVGRPQHARCCIGVGEAVITGDPGTAKGLDRLVDDPAVHVWGRRP
jgi:hypothetical protein